MDEESRKQLPILMGVSVHSVDGRSLSGLTVTPEDFGRFALGQTVELAPCDVTKAARTIERTMESAGFTVGSETLPGVPGPSQFTRRPAQVGVIVADRTVEPDAAYNRTTRLLGGSLVVVWMAWTLTTVIFERSEWPLPDFVGGLFLAVPAFMIVSYRGAGYTSTIVVARLEARGRVERISEGTPPPLGLGVTLGIGKVQSRQTMGRNAGFRKIVSVSNTPGLAPALNELYERWRSPALEPAEG